MSSKTMSTQQGADPDSRALQDISAQNVTNFTGEGAFPGTFAPIIASVGNT